jgi:hypothetical protein
MTYKCLLSAPLSDSDATVTRSRELSHVGIHHLYLSISITRKVPTASAHTLLGFIFITPTHLSRPCPLFFLKLCNFASLRNCDSNVENVGSTGSKVHWTGPGPGLEPAREVKHYLIHFASSPTQVQRTPTQVHFASTHCIREKGLVYVHSSNTRGRVVE